MTQTKAKSVSIEKKKEQKILQKSNLWGEGGKGRLNGNGKI